MEGVEDHTRPDLESTRGSSWPYAPPLTSDQASELRREGEYISGMVKETTAWDVYNNEARKMDNELVKDWMASLNFLLVFAAIFSAVLSAFIIESKKLLQQDPNEVMVDIMIFYTNNVAIGVNKVYDRQDFQPSNSAISINCLLFGSLSASLVAALASVIALQWVAEYDAAITRGGSSPQDRAKRRQFRYAGVEKWKMGGIIASLPLLLYFSVVLFFAGVIQWMILVYATVGYVVAGGAAIAALFYVSSTVVSVMFVSAPFKSPLTRWIYSSYYLFIAMAYQIITAVRINKVPRWIESRHKKYDVTHKREDIAVENRVNLNYQAMHWLARQVSISEDSRRRLNLLVSELVRWPMAQIKSPEFRDGPWITILNFLAQKYRKSAHISHQTRTEEQEFALLVNCAALPGVAAIITPQFDYHDYIVDLDDAMYWPQHCLTSEGNPVYEKNFLSGHLPETVFLVTRDLPAPSLRTTSEMRVTLKLAKWRNTQKKSFTFLQGFFNATDTFSDKFFDDAVCFFSNYAVAYLRHNPMPLVKITLYEILKRIVDRASKSGISSVALNALTRALESTIQAETAFLRPSSAALLQLPLSYGLNIDQWGSQDRRHELHCKVALLLAREVYRLPNPERPRRVLDVLAMLWLDRPFNNNRQDWIRLTNEYGDSCRLHMLDGQILCNWSLYAGSPDILDAVRALIQTSSDDPDFGLSWLYSCAKNGRTGVFAILKLFDRLLSEKHSTIAPLTIVRTLCRMLKTEQFIAYGRSFSQEDTAPPTTTLRTPCLRLIAYRALEMECVEEIMLDQPMWSDVMDETIQYIFWNMSMRDPQSVWQVRAWLLFDSAGHNYSDLVTRMLERAFQDPDQLFTVDRIFAERTLCKHYAGPIHILHHLQSAVPPVVIFRSDIWLFNGISLRNVKLAPITALLAASSLEELSLLGLPQQVDKTCMLDLWSHIQSFRNIQSAMLGFLLDLPLLYTPAAKWASFAVLLHTIEGSIGLPTDNASITLLLPMSKRIQELPRSYFEFLSSEDIEQWNAELTTLLANGDRISNLALTRLATLTVFGRINHRSLSCAKSSCDIRAATSWWPMYT